MGIKDWVSRNFGNIAFSSADPTPVLHFLRGSSAGVDVTYSSVMGIAAFWRAVEVISDGMVDLPVSVRMPSGDGTDVAEDHPMQMLLENGVNDEMDATDFVRVTAHQLATYGNSYWEIRLMGDGMVEELIPLDPSQTRPYVVNGMKHYKGVYTNVAAVYGMPATLMAEDVLHVRGMSRTGFYGMSPIEYCQSVLGLAIAAPEYGGDFFANGGVPLLALLMEEEAALSAKQIRDLQQRWSASFSRKSRTDPRTGDQLIREGGAQENAGQDVARGVKVAEGVKDIKMLTIAPNESQFLETRVENVREVARITGVPPSKLFETSHSTYNNEAEEARAFVNDTLKPMGRRIAAAITNQILEPPYTVEFDLSGALVPPFKERMEGYAAALTAGVYTIQEVREMEGLPALSDEELQQMAGNGSMDAQEEQGDMMDEEMPDERSVHLNGVVA